MPRLRSLDNNHPNWHKRYEVLNKDKSNAILVLHALSGDAHAAGVHKGEDDPGWWDDMIGPDKAFDTNKYFIICSNVIGGCKGSTGPSSLNPATGKPYALDFPFITSTQMLRSPRIPQMQASVTCRTGRPRR